MQTGDLIAGRYRLEEPVGSGGNGVVWRALDDQLDRTVALKRAIPGDPGPYGEQLQQLRREARLLAQLNHRHIVTLYDVLDEGDDCWLVMEYVPAKSLAERGVLPAAVAAGLGAQIADALAAVHAKGILHRDVKPANILMISDHEAKLGDFGISRVLAGDETVTGSTVLAGTPGYLAPEVANGSDPTAASDIFSLGSALYAAVEGTSPVGDTTDNAFLRLRRAAEGRIRPCRTTSPLTPVLTQLLQVNPVKRPTAAQARVLLTQAADVSDRPVPQQRSRRGLLIAGAVIVMLALGLGSWFALGAPQQPQQSSQPFTGSVFGDVATADPCKIVNPTVMAQFGDPNLVGDEYDFDQCNIIVKVDDHTRQSDLTIKLAITDPSVATSGRMEDKPTFRLVREDATASSCERRLLFPGHLEIQLLVNRVTMPEADVCRMADVAADSAMATVAKGPIPRRADQVNPLSLIRKNACDAGRSSQFPPGLPGVNPAAPDLVGYGKWRCTWGSEAGPISLMVEFGRREPFDQGPGQRIQVNGQPAVIDPPEDENTCEVEVLNLPGPKIEAVYANVESTQKTQEERCAIAVQLAGAATAG